MSAEALRDALARSMVPLPLGEGDIDLAATSDLAFAVDSEKVLQNRVAALAMLSTVAQNILQNPMEPKFRSINIDGNAVAATLAPVFREGVVGVERFLVLVGFERCAPENAGGDGAPRRRMSFPVSLSVPLSRLTNLDVAATDGLAENRQALGRLRDAIDTKRHAAAVRASQEERQGRLERLQQAASHTTVASGSAASSSSSVASSSSPPLSLLDVERGIADWLRLHLEGANGPTAEAFYAIAMQCVDAMAAASPATRRRWASPLTLRVDVFTLLSQFVAHLAHLAEGTFVVTAEQPPIQIVSVKENDDGSAVVLTWWPGEIPNGLSSSAYSPVLELLLPSAMPIDCGRRDVETTPSEASSVVSHAVKHTWRWPNQARALAVWQTACERAKVAIQRRLAELFETKSEALKRQRGSTSTAPPRPDDREESAVSSRREGAVKRPPLEAQATAATIIADIAGYMETLWHLNGAVGYVAEHRRRARELHEAYDADGDLNKLYAEKESWKRKLESEKARLGKATVFL